MRHVLPKGPVDLLRQLGLFAGAYMLYRLVRGLVDGRAAVAFDNARELIELERDLDLFVEPAIHAWASGETWVIDTASWLYVNSHFTLTFAALAYIYLRRNRFFYFVRNMLMVSMGIALVGYVVYPTAPPRLMREWGFRDPVAEFTGGATTSASADVLYNAYAAVPSMHVAFALIIGLAMARMVRRPWARVAWSLYPLLVTFVVVATANHWWMDALLGALTAGAAALVAQALFARVRPAAWAWAARPGVAA